MQVICGITALFASASACAAYDAVNDFSLANNPNGVWSYGTLSTVTGGTFTPFSLTGSDVNFTGEQYWTNGAGIPNAAFVGKNNSGTTVTYGSATQPASELRLDGENLDGDLRFVSPATALYSVTGLFERIDNGNVPVTVSIVENGAITLFSASDFTTFGSQQAFDLPALLLPAGTTLDFVESAPQFNNDSTGVAATINAVPEPTSITVAVLGLACVVFRRRKIA